MKKYLLVLAVLLLFVKVSYCEEINESPKLEKNLSQITATIEKYNIAQGEGLAMTALRLERCVGSRLLIGPEIDWAIIGKRGGYFAGGVNLGLILIKSKYFQINSRTFFGGGGGGAMNLYAGGGMIFKFSGEVIKPITKSLSLRGEFGLIRFVNGRISSKLIAGGISYQYFKIREKKDIIN